MAIPLKATPAFNKAVFLLIKNDDSNPLDSGYAGEDSQTTLSAGSGNTMQEAVMDALENGEIREEHFDSTEGCTISVWMLNKNNTSCKDFVYVGELNYGHVQFIPAN